MFSSSKSKGLTTRRLQRGVPGPLSVKPRIQLSRTSLT